MVIGTIQMPGGGNRRKTTSSGGICLYTPLALIENFVEGLMIGSRPLLCRIQGLEQVIHSIEVAQITS